MSRLEGGVIAASIGALKSSMALSLESVKPVANNGQVVHPAQTLKRDFSKQTQHVPQHHLDGHRDNPAYPSIGSGIQ